MQRPLESTAATAGSRRQAVAGIFAVLVTGTLLLNVTAVQAGPTPAQKCEASKLKAAGKKAACRMTALAKIATGGRDDLAKCSEKFLSAFAKAETKAGGGVCPTEGDADAVERAIDADTNALRTMLHSRFVDNGDGTVTDNQTGLQWEKKTTVVGSGVDLSNPHDVDNTYQWCLDTDFNGCDNPGDPPDGSAFTEFLADLNTGPCFAGHCDWRLPSQEGRNSPFTGAKEMESILLAASPCGTSPCIDPIFGPTSAADYWSATTDATLPSYAWVVNFGAGYVGFSDFKFFGTYVRAVRAGS